MATALNTLYPPVISTFREAFIYDQDVRIYFSLSSYNSINDIERVHISLVNQKNNENALNDETGIIFDTPTEDKDLGLYYVTIHTSDLKSTGTNVSVDSEGNQRKSFNINQLYKVQLRFDNDRDDFQKYVVESGTAQSKTRYLLRFSTRFSEWSSVQLIRPIYYPHIRIKTFDLYNDSASTGGTLQSFPKGMIPIVGGLYFNSSEDGKEMDDAETETLQSYTISVMKEDTDGHNKVLRQYPTIYTGNQLDPNDINYNIDLQNIGEATVGSTLTIRIDCYTRNQYHLEPKDYQITVSNFSNVENFEPTITEKVNDETGIVTLTIDNAMTIVGGTVYVKRSSSVDNFTEEELILSKNMRGKDTFPITVKDNTVQSLTWYRYSVQAIKNGELSRVTYSDVIMPAFYDAILSRGDQQYDIKYNYNISSYKPVVNRAKLDTLGSKYPKFAENAVLDYKQFSISGLISAEADVYQDFVQKNNVYSGRMSNYYDSYKEHPTTSILGTAPDDKRYEEQTELRDLVRNDFPDYFKYSDDDTKQPFTENDLAKTTSQNFLTTTENDWMWEREFRERLIKWLNDGEPKLYRSRQEGNMVVMLTDISLTPTANFARFTYSFSATMYECADATSLDLLDELGIYDVKTAEELSQTDGGKEVDYTEVLKLGQIYNLTIRSEQDGGVGKNNILDLITNDLKMQYGRKGTDDDGNDIYDIGHNIQSSLKPDHIILKNVKIYFHNSPNLYYLTSGDEKSGGGQYNMFYTSNTHGENTYDNNQVAAADINTKTRLGYTFNLKTGSDGDLSSVKQVFVNERGYYQIPSNLDVTHLSFNHIGDVVTIEYTLAYRELENTAESVSGTSIGRTVIGQYFGVFNPNTFYGQKIKNKYAYTASNKMHRQEMEYWQGICLDVTPYAMCAIQYDGVNGTTTYEVGGTGVLHMLKDFNVKDIEFLGRRMKIYTDMKKQKYLHEWECVLDSSVTSSPEVASKLNWFTVANVDTKNKVTIYDDGENADGNDNIVTTFRRVGEQSLGAKGVSPYANTAAIHNPKRNVVYLLDDGSMKIYYDNNFYDFEIQSRDTADFSVPNSTTDQYEVGLAKVPVQGYVNYFGSVVQKNLLG